MILLLSAFLLPLPDETTVRGAFKITGVYCMLLFLFLVLMKHMTMLLNDSDSTDFFGAH